MDIHLGHNIIHSKWFRWVRILIQTTVFLLRPRRGLYSTLLSWHIINLCVLFKIPEKLNHSRAWRLALNMILITNMAWWLESHDTTNHETWHFAQIFNNLYVSNLLTIITYSSGKSTTFYCSLHLSHQVFSHNDILVENWWESTLLAVRQHDPLGFISSKLVIVYCRF